MRLRATLFDEALRLYPLAVLINVVGVLMIPGMFCLFRFGLLLTSLRWALVSIGLGIVACCVMLALGSLVEDVHDIKMHTMSYDLVALLDEEDMVDDTEGAEEADAQAAEETPEAEAEPEAAE